MITIESMQIYSFTIIIEKDENGYYLAEIPSLPGCHTQAKTLPTLHKRIKEAAELYLEVQKNEKTPIPKTKFIAVQQLELSA